VQLSTAPTKQLVCTRMNYCMCLQCLICTTNKLHIAPVCALLQLRLQLLPRPLLLCPPPRVPPVPTTASSYALPGGTAPLAPQVSLQAWEAS
jgi:hypothetical protein